VSFKAITSLIPCIKMSVSVPNTTILFHGNCIDGWFAAYILHASLKNTGSTINMFPISPNQIRTWPKMHIMKDSRVYLVDVSVPADIRQKWMNSGVLSINCIDHHQTSIDHWTGTTGQAHIDTTQCAALLTWNMVNPGASAANAPMWLQQIDRLDRWDNPTYEDRCLREMLNIISHLPVQGKLEEAFAMTNMFIIQYNDPVGFTNILQQGAALLAQKNAGLNSILQAGMVVQIDETALAAWQLPAEWLGVYLFIINTTSITLDSTEASHLVFQSLPAVQVFINYRVKTSYHHIEGAKTHIIYSARSKADSTLDLTRGTIFAGHPNSAGASRTIGVDSTPFLMQPVTTTPVNTVTASVATH
jgi:hypothetical protein